MQKIEDLLHLCSYSIDVDFIYPFKLSLKYATEVQYFNELPCYTHTYIRIVVCIHVRDIGMYLF